MEEDQIVKQQDDLEKIIAHMRAAALKHGKDWLRAKIEDKGGESQEREAELPAPLKLTDNAGITEHTTPHNRRQTNDRGLKESPQGNPPRGQKSWYRAQRMTQQQHQRPADRECQQRVSI
ncbi:hypothetical protein NDU88_001891 [Pleurodeles waltl]|uniref:Uncharacterized protein n=1 Tax=Pleurodeles waltl TaxID=8319 RepID=A0AAV7RE50_PLEWA|nr:hypothetical protein NDU88_001891 [Pleurodeles waltl]